MTRPPRALLILVLACVAGVALPTGTGALPAAHAAAKHRCKHRAHKHHRRCRAKPSTPTDQGFAGVTGSTIGTVTGSSGGSSTPSRLLATEREVSATELQLQLSRATLPAGTAIVEQYNAGSDPHNLVAERQSAVAFAFPDLAPGGDQKQTVSLQPGTYTLYCSLLDHRSLGMQATLTVN
jgi:plastocyanin